MVKLVFSHFYKVKKQVFRSALIFILYSFLFISCSPADSQDQEKKDTLNSNIKYSGVRASSYGISPFPTSIEWENCIKQASSFFPGSQPASIWIVGVANETNSGITLEFPSPGGSYDKIEFSETDLHESCFDCFDDHNIKIFLQIEPGFADIETLIDLVLNQYKHHTSVIGFGIDIEWYKNVAEGNPGEKTSDELALAWENKVKLHNSSYNFFLKHWDRDWMPPVYRGNIIFVDDSQGFASLNDMVIEFSDYWADYFYPNTVFFQTGYDSDKPWWSLLTKPIPEIGNAVSIKVNQNCGIIWVDFTIESVITFR